MQSFQQPSPARREDLLVRLAQPGTWDLAVVGGGATGVGVALDAAARGLSVVLLDSHDFAGGTSSRATKLVHGGVRYLGQGNVALVREALRERQLLMRNAPHLAQPLAFVMPSYRPWETPFYGAGLKLYDALAAKAGLGPTRLLGRKATLVALPGVKPEGLRGGVEYWDGQFDDARLALAVARTAAAHGALVVNYCPVTGILHAQGRVAGVQCQDAETGRSFEVKARCVINATGVWVDHLRRLDGELVGHREEAIVAPSQGVHLVVDRAFLPGPRALVVPRTADGRVLFGVPWLGKLILGTTDTPCKDLPREPRPSGGEIDFILGEASRYLARRPRLQDVRSAWVGLRPLVRPPGGAGADTKALSREHLILVSRTGLVTITGGKWTTYRAMAQDVLSRCSAEGLIRTREACRTASLPLVGGEAVRTPVPLSEPPGPHLYGSEARLLASLPGSGSTICDGLTEAMVRFAARHEHARTVEDVLARRSRLLFLDAALAGSVAQGVARILREETGVDPQQDAFCALAASYLPAGAGGDVASDAPRLQVQSVPAA